MFKQVKDGTIAKLDDNAGQVPNKMWVDPLLKTGITRELDKYPSTLNFYFEVPDVNVPIDTLMRLAVGRQSILCSISEAKTRLTPHQEADKIINNLIQKHLPLSRNHLIHRLSLTKVLEERINDAISHHILRLVHCRSQESRTWFTNMEADLFVRRFKAEDSTTRKKFFECVFNNNIPVLSQELKNKYLRELCMCSGLSEFEIFNMDFYLVTFQNAGSLVSHRKVFLNRGMAYVPCTEQAILLFEAFKYYISKSLLSLSLLDSYSLGKKINYVVEKISSQCNSLFRHEFAFDVNESSTKFISANKPTKNNISDTQNTALSFVNIKNSIEYFPPCMRNIQNILSSTGHLKHNDRLKYGLFLKCAGMPFNESMLFWERSMYNVPASAFKKEYSYYIRYNYGLEGKRKNFPPWSCRDILSRDSPTGNHGCPFRELANDDLKSFIESNYKCKPEIISKVLSTTKQGHHQLACTTLLKYLCDPSIDTETQPQTEEVLESPNQFFGRLVNSRNTETAIKY